MNGSNPRVASVLVTGDVVTDRDLYAGQGRRPGSRMRLGTVDQPVPGGAAFLDLLLRAVAQQRPGGGLAVASGLDYPKVMRSAPIGYSLMQPFPREPGVAGQVWRMAPEPHGSLGMGSVDADLDVSAADAAVLGAAHAVVVLDDAGLAFRRWPSRAAWPRFLLESGRPLPDWLVLKLSAPLAAGDLWHTLVSGSTQDRKPRRVRDPAELLTRIVVVAGINDLRVEPIHVSRDLSWERAALDLFQELAESRCAALTALRRVRFVVVALDTDGALIAEFPQGRGPRAWLVFDPARLEGDFAAEVPGAGVLGYQTCFTAAIVAELASPRRGDSSEPAATLVDGVRAGLAAKRRLLLEGHGPAIRAPGAPGPGFQKDAVAAEIGSEPHHWVYGAVEIPHRPGKRGAPQRGVLLRSDPWTIIAGRAVARGKPVPLWGLARRVARHGVQQLKETPYFQCGQLFSIERTEIESLRTLQRLLRTYRDDRGATKLLSIAAFGPPGAGKSFGIKQLSAQVLQDREPLEFNLSQFQDPAELHGLLHQVRDRVLLGKLPLVFWDEFDSQDFRWLQFLLAPMQDGTFQEGPITHPIGKCVFVFAGGTRSRFEDFGVPPPELKGAARDAWETGFRAKKGPDFKSRLAGYLNVIGPNRRDKQDITYPVRRALLLRVHLGVGPEATLTIERGLLAAFLKIGEYRHGARSLEKIAEQLRRRSRTGEFTRSDLPSRRELDLHVDADEFLARMEAAL